MSTAGLAYGDGSATHFGSDLVVGAREGNANAVAIIGAIAGANPQIVAVGDDTNISLKLTPKGTGVIVGLTAVVGNTTATTITTAGAVTYTAAQILGGLILRDPNGAGRSDIMPTAALLLAAIPGAAIGSSFEFIIRNDADAAETITVTSGTGGPTLSGTMTIAQNNLKRFRAVFTNVTTAAYTVYSLGTETF